MLIGETRSLALILEPFAADGREHHPHEQHEMLCHAILRGLAREDSERRGEESRPSSLVLRSSMEFLDVREQSGQRIDTSLKTNVRSNIEILVIKGRRAIVNIA